MMMSTMGVIELAPRSLCRNCDGHVTPSRVEGCSGRFALAEEIEVQGAVDDAGHGAV